MYHTRSHALNCSTGARVCLAPTVFTVLYLASVGLTQEAGLGGRIGTLPGAESTQTSGMLLESHVKLLATSLDQAIEDLQHAKLQAFAKSYARMVAAYNQLSDQIGDASASIGDADVQVQLASETLGTLKDAQPMDSEKRRRLGADIGQIRALLMGKLTSTKALFEQTKDAADRAKYAHQLRGLVNRVKQLDSLGNSLTTAARPILPGVAANELRTQLETIVESLEEEEHLLGVLAESVRLLVDTATAEMRRTMTLLEVSASIPREQLRDLARTRANVQRALDQIAAAHQKAQVEARGILAPSDPPLGAIDETALLREVESLLQQSATP